MLRAIVSRVSRATASQTLAGRLAAGGLAWIAVWGLALALIFNVLLANVLEEQVDAALRARAQAVAATVSYDAGRLSVLPGADDALDIGTTIYLGTTVFEGNGLPEALTAQLVQRGEETADREVPSATRFLAEPIRSQGRQVATVIVSSDTGSSSRTERVVAIGSVVLILVMLGFTFFALRGTIRRAMRPVRQMGEQASAWSEQDIDRRFDPDAGPLELRELALTLNALLERIAATLRHERSFTAELAHELRTPLAHLHAEVDLLASGLPNPSTPVTTDDLGRLQVSVRRLEDLVETSLTPARAGVLQAAGLVRVADLLADLPPPPSAVRARGVDLVVTGDLELVLAVEHDIARRAVLPVLENAWRYAAAHVRIDVSAAGGTARIEVRDDGGRLTPDLVGSVFDPGFRADPGDDHPGAGLGLALTRRISRAAGGDATAGTEPGWTLFVLELPCIQR